MPLEVIATAIGGVWLAVALGVALLIGKMFKRRGDK